MKKIIFAVQVFGIIAALPLYIIAELNQVKSTSSLSKISSGMNEIQEKAVSKVLADTTVVFESQYLAFIKQYKTVIKSN